MGVYRTDYIIFGADINAHYNDDWYENDDMLPYLEGHKAVEFEIIVDGMSGNYAMAGKVLGRYDYHDGLPMVEFAEIFNKAVEDFDKVEEFLNRFDKDLVPRIFIFTHWH